MKRGRGRGEGEGEKEGEGERKGEGRGGRNSMTVELFFAVPQQLVVTSDVSRVMLCLPLTLHRSPNSLTWD